MYCHMNDRDNAHIYEHYNVLYRHNGDRINVHTIISTIEITHIYANITTYCHMNDRENAHI